MLDLSTRFWSKVDRSGECWRWTGTKNAKGYGVTMTTATICTDSTCPIPVRHETFPEHTPEDTLRKMGLTPSIVAELTGTTSEPCSDSHDFMLRCFRCGVKGSIHLSIAGADEEVSVVKRAAIVPCPDCGAEPHEGACETDR